jgi:parallel beta-helix repeat protein
LIAHCQFFNNDYQSIQSQNGYYPLGQYAEKITITDCSIHHNGREEYSWDGGICILNLEDIACSNIDISNCDIYDNIGDGIFLDWTPNVTIHHNKIHGNTYMGIDCLAYVHSNFVGIYNNLIYNNEHYGIRICSRDNFSNITISGNTILSNGNGTNENYSTPSDGGIIIQEVLSPGLIIKYNTIAYNNMCGIQLSGTSGVKVTQNNFFDNVYYDAYFDYAYWDEFFPLNKWESNYWDRPRLLPKLIFGLIFFYDFDIWCFAFDWHPTQEPYDIPRMT